MSKVNLTQPQATMPVPNQLMQMVTGQYLTQAIYVVAKLGIADLVKDDSQSVDQLAESIAVDSQYLYRLLRALASHGIFTEVAPRRFATTPLGRYLQSDLSDSFRDVAIFEGEEWLWQSWGNMFNAVKTGSCGFESKFGMSVIDYLNQNPSCKETFKKAHQTYSTIINNAVIDAYDFSSISKLVDVGGGDGALLSTLLQANSAMTGVLFDLPTVIEHAQQANHWHTELEGRYVMVSGDFLESVPSSGNTCVLKQIIHNWDDQSAIRILKNCNQAMPSEGKLLVIDPLISAQESSFATFLDLQFLLVQPKARIRTTNEFRELFRQAGWQLKNIISTRSPCCIIEGFKS